MPQWRLANNKPLNKFKLQCLYLPKNWRFCKSRKLPFMSLLESTWLSVCIVYCSGRNCVVRLLSLAPRLHSACNNIIRRHTLLQYRHPLASVSCAAFCSYHHRSLYLVHPTITLKQTTDIDVLVCEPRLAYRLCWLILSASCPAAGHHITSIHVSGQPTLTSWNVNNVTCRLDREHFNNCAQPSSLQYSRMQPCWLRLQPTEDCIRSGGGSGYPLYWASPPWSCAVEACLTRLTPRMTQYSIVRGVAPPYVTESRGFLHPGRSSLTPLSRNSVPQCQHNQLGAQLTSVPHFKERKHRQFNFQSL